MFISLLVNYYVNLAKKTMTATIIYQGNLRCSAEHLQSGSILETDAPTDNRGKGERFSPTDLVCVALATCIVTTIAMKATDMELNIDATKVSVTKYMASDPRRIGKIDVTIQFPEKVDEKTKTILQRVGHTCPVHRSIHPDVEMNIVYVWN
jgi:putative redox protein